MSLTYIGQNLVAKEGFNSLAIVNATRALLICSEFIVPPTSSTHDASPKGATRFFYTGSGTARQEMPHGMAVCRYGAGFLRRVAPHSTVP